MNAIPSVPGAMTRAVSLRIPHTRHKGEGFTQVELIGLCNATEGALLLDMSGRRRSVYVGGGPSRYEITTQLLPGWEPASEWDVNPDDAGAVDEAIAASDGESWEDMYVIGRANYLNIYNSTVGRHWVLNEDGSFVASRFRRAFGPWSMEEAWYPYDFAKSGGIKDLTQRGDAGWSTRRRRFLRAMAVNGNDASDPLRAEYVGTQVAISFNGDAGPWYYKQVTVEVLDHRCGIMIQDADLRLVQCEDEEDTFVTAYIRGKLRIKITATIEGDDAVYGYSGDSNQVTLPWEEYIDRSPDFRRDVRTRSTNDYLAFGLKLPDDRNDTLQADALAYRMLSEFSGRRCSGQATVPCILQPRNDVPWPTFQPGNEVYEVYTDDYRSRITLVSGGRDRPKAPRVNSITHTWCKDPPAANTLVQLEDETYGPDDVVGPRLVSDPREAARER